jgi:hypothetical protein
MHNEGSFRFTALRDDRRDPVPLIRREITRSFPEEEGLGVALASGSQKAVSGADNLRLVMTNYGAQVTGSRVGGGGGRGVPSPRQKTRTINGRPGARWGVPAPCCEPDNYVTP